MGNLYCRSNIEKAIEKLVVNTYFRFIILFNGLQRREVWLSAQGCSWREKGSLVRQKHGRFNVDYAFREAEVV
jgi:hypothetical protein